MTRPKAICVPLRIPGPGPNGDTGPAVIRGVERAEILGQRLPGHDPGQLDQLVVQVHRQAEAHGRDQGDSIGRRLGFWLHRYTRKAGGFPFLFGVRDTPIIP